MSTHTFKVLKGTPTGALTTAEGTRTLRPTEAWIDLTHCGVCGTDEHYRKAPMGLGHEGVGVVKELGNAAKVVNAEIKVGDRVGMGWMQRMCGYCKPCLTGLDVYCVNADQYGTANHDQGCFGTGLAWDVSALYKIPDEIKSEDAGPLMCGGATVWGPLYQHGAKAGDRVGVVGIGGLGHMAIQFASKMGMEVVVFSSTESKKEEAMKFGASKFVATKGKETIEGVAPVDFLLVTTNQQPDYNLYLPLMAKGGKIFPLTVSFGTHPIPMLPLITGGVSIIGSAGAYRQSIKEMLKFCAKYGVKPQIQKFPMTEQGVTEAMNVLEAGRMRYRGVTEAQKA